MKTQEELNTLDFEIQNTATDEKTTLVSLLKYLIIGSLFGIILVKSEVISWFRIQEMFRFESFHMYGVIGTAVVVGMISIQIIKRLKIKNLSGETIKIESKGFSKGQIYGGLTFGFGWALTGACPGPIYAQIGTGVGVFLIVLLSALAGAWVYGFLQKRLPH